MSRLTFQILPPEIVFVAILGREERPELRKRDGKSRYVERLDRKPGVTFDLDLTARDRTP
jgi:hypothetical protein